MITNTQNYRIILASTSKRRREFLAQLEIKHTAMAPDFEEKIMTGESCADYVQRNAKGKALSVCTMLEPIKEKTVIISADTVVHVDEQVLEKPVDFDDAVRMMHLLSGKTHQVMSGLFILIIDENQVKKEICRLISTDVTMKKLTDYQIEQYCLLEEPYDKSGGYAIQGKGSFMVESIHGSVTNVTGLPLAQLFDLLDENL